MKTPEVGPSDREHGAAERVERREFTRVNLRVQVEVMPLGGGSIKGWTSNLSIGGWYVVTEVDLPVGTPCVIRFLGPDGSEVVATGRIVRRDTRGLGGELLHMDLSSLANMGRILRMEAPPETELLALFGPEEERDKKPVRETAKDSALGAIDHPT